MQADPLARNGVGAGCWGVDLSQHACSISEGDALGASETLLRLLAVPGNAVRIADYWLHVKQNFSPLHGSTRVSTLALVAMSVEEYVEAIVRTLCTEPLALAVHYTRNGWLLFPFGAVHKELVVPLEIIGSDPYTEAILYACLGRMCRASHTLAADVNSDHTAGAFRSIPDSIVREAQRYEDFRFNNLLTCVFPRAEITNAIIYTACSHAVAARRHLKTSMHIDYVLATRIMFVRVLYRVAVAVVELSQPVEMVAAATETRRHVAFVACAKAERHAVARHVIAHLCAMYKVCCDAKLFTPTNLLLLHFYYHSYGRYQNYSSHAIN